MTNNLKQRINKALLGFESTRKAKEILIKNNCANDAVTVSYVSILELENVIKELLEREEKLTAGIKVHIKYEDSQMEIICKAAKHWKGMTTKNRRRWHRLQELKKVLEELGVK